MGGRIEKATNQRDVLANIFAIVVVVALVATALAYGIDALGRQAREAERNPGPVVLVAVNIAGVALSIPIEWMRFPGQKDSDFSDRLDLVVPMVLGDMAPAQIGLTLMPKARARASSALLDSVYLQHFTAEEMTGVPGLIGKPLGEGSGYAGETVWYDPIHADPFVAKCAPPIAADGFDACLRTLSLDSGLVVVVGFPEAALPRWRQFDEPLAAVLTRIGAGKILR